MHGNLWKALSRWRKIWLFGFVRFAIAIPAPENQLCARRAWNGTISTALAWQLLLRGILGFAVCVTKTYKQSKWWKMVYFFFENFLSSIPVSFFVSAYTCCDCRFLEVQADCRWSQFARSSRLQFAVLELVVRKRLLSTSALWSHALFE